MVNELQNQEERGNFSKCIYIYATFDRPLFCSYDGIKKEPFSLTNPFAEKAIWQDNPNYGQYKDFG